jgi:uncharacterized protein with HEPN domain
MSQHRDEAYLHDVVRAARLIVQFTDETDAEDFQTDAFAQSAILHQFLVLGEATKRLSTDFRTAHPDIPWRQMAGMRDRLIHDYDTIDLDLVWETATRNIPALLDQLEPLLPE